MKVGDKVYLVYEDSRLRSQYVTIKSIGSKYITVDGVHRSESRYNILTKESVDDRSGWNCRARLYESKEKYFEQQLEDACVDKVKTRIVNYIQHHAIELKMLHTIAKLLKIETELL